MGKFIADPEILIKEGTGIIGISDEFIANVNDTYDTLDNLVANEYMSPEAIAIKKEIDTYREDLEKMATVINDYGRFCVNSGEKVIKNQDGIIDEIK